MGRTIFGVSALVIAVVVYFLLGFGHVDRPPVAAPISTSKDATFTFRFQVRREARYRAAVEIDRVFPTRETECLIGVGMTPSPGLRTDCPPGFDSPDISWSLLADRHSASIDSFAAHSGGYSNRAISQDLGVFSGIPGQDYIATLTIRHPSAQLTNAHPRFVIALDPMEIESDVVKNTFLLLVSGVLAISGAALLGLELVARSRQKRAKRSA